MLGFGKQSIHFYPVDEQEVAADKKMFNWQNKKLVVFASCQSAGPNSSFTEFSLADIVSRNHANTVIGWYSDINTIGSTEWLDYFNNKLATGANALDAANYANGKEYDYNNVKNCFVMYWDSPVTLSNEEVMTLNTQINQTEDNNILVSKNMSKYDVSDVEDVMKSIVPDFNEEDYEKTIAEGVYAKNMTTGVVEHVESYIDYSYKIGDFVTNSVYTVVLDKNGNIKAINDNTKDISSNITNARNVNNFNVSEKDTKNYLNKAKENIKDINNIEQEEIKFLYDVTTNKKSANVFITMKDSNTLFFEYEI